MLLNDNWQFAKLPTGSALEDVLSLREEDWQAVDIPHDWLIGQEEAFYESADGWYRRRLNAAEADAGRVWLVRFDGVYMDCDVLLNGEVVCTHRYGYTAFDADLTGRVRSGENLLMVHVRFRSPNSRWYSGAGIFRDVTLSVLPEGHIVPDGVYASTVREADGTWRATVSVATAHVGDGERLSVSLFDAAGNPVATARPAIQGNAAEAELRVDAPRLWSCESPYLYTLVCERGEQAVSQRIGFRETEFDPNRGFLLNGEHVKLRGVCLHHDLGALGSAFNAVAFRRQMRVMRDMGVNALRTSHNPPASRALNICDEMGILVIDEFLDMWERPKTAFDYARFFPEEWRGDVRRWVERDRNHACVVMWSIGNEIHDTHVSSRGEEVTAMLRDAVREHDPRGNAAVTIGSNYMPWEGARRCADLLKIAGYNYGEKFYDAHHAAHPDWVIYGSETASILSSRGVYHFPADANILSEEDLQCSALGNSCTSWGTPDMRRCLIDDVNNPYSMGQFLWSGFDYIGEPTPYHTRSCYFGMVDTAGFPKDFFYQIKAVWNPEPMVRIGVSWDWNPGQLIDIPVYTNGASCELFFNGTSLGRKAVNLRVPEESVPLWRLPYTLGTLTAKAYDDKGNVIAGDERRSHGDSARLVLSAERTALRADGEDIAFITVSAVDAAGNPVDNAADRVRVSVDGAARLLGLDNGDSTDADGYRQDSRCLFNGKLLILAGSTNVPGGAVVRAEALGLEAAELRLTLEPAQARAGIGTSFTAPLHATRSTVAVPARRVELRAEGETALTPERPEVFFRAALLPANADAQEIRYRVVNAMGIETPCAEAIPVPGGVKVVGRGDGRAWLRAACNNGAEHTRVLSQMELTLTGFGSACLDPYGFVSAGLYDISDGEITAGNDKGVSFARDGDSMAGFTSVDFGPVGSDEITLPVFALDGDLHEIGLWMGDPRDGGHLVMKLPYQKPSRWNVYQEETWKLPERFTGVQTVAFTMSEKAHLKGFAFAKQSRAWLPLAAGGADEIYGDSFTRDGDAIRGIGNNVSLVFRDMDFGDGGRVLLEITGRTPLDVNPVQVRVAGPDGESMLSECAFRHSDASRTQTFAVYVPAGACVVSFVFLPGCNFDFEGFRFRLADENGMEKGE